MEDVGKTRRDDTADAKIEERPGRMLATRPATEIIRADQALGIAVWRLVEDAIRVLGPVRAKADLLEKPLREPGPLDRLQTARREDLVGSEVADRQRGRSPCHLSEFLH